MRLKTQSHLITVALTALVTWQLARATEPAPAAPAPAVATPREPATEAGPGAPRVRVRPAPSERAFLAVAEDDLSLTVAPDDRGQVTVPDLVAAFAAARGLSFTLDPQAAAQRIELGGETTLDRRGVRRVLASVDVLLITDGAGGVEARHLRNAAQRSVGTWPLVSAGAVADPDQPVTRVVPLYHGGGNAIFATLRGLMTRDPSRLGNVLYVPGAEQLVLCDLALNVRAYEELVAALDVPQAPLSEAR
ncbi:MAG: hypothetical protein R3F62_08030 [Planctomycetota bacterium]